MVGNEYFSSRDVYGEMPYATTGEQTVPEHAESLVYLTPGSGGHDSQEVVTKSSMIKTVLVFAGIIGVLGILGIAK